MTVPPRERARAGSAAEQSFISKQFAMNQRKLTRMAAALACTATICGAAAACVFIWNGTGTGDVFSNSDNWVDQVTPCPVGWPNRTEDDAKFPWNASGAWAVDLVTATIGDLTIDGSVDFDTPGGTPTLQAAKLIITPTSGDIEITMNGAAKITVP